MGRRGRMNYDWDAKTKTCGSCNQKVSFLMKTGECQHCWDASQPKAEAAPQVEESKDNTWYDGQGNSGKVTVKAAPVAGSGIDPIERDSMWYLTAEERGYQPAPVFRGQHEVKKVGLGRYQCTCGKTYLSRTKARGAGCGS